MSEPFLSEVRIISFNFAPRGWALCNGQLLPINQNQALFSLLGTTFGGDGRVTFALPSLQGRTPIHTGSGFTLGERGGEERHTLTQAELPAHTHSFKAGNGDPNSSSGYLPSSSLAPYTASGGGGALSPASISSVGGSQPHTNMQPSLTLNFIIARQGIFPSPN